MSLKVSLSWKVIWKVEKLYWKVEKLFKNINVLLKSRKDIFKSWKNHREGIRKVIRKGLIFEKCEVIWKIIIKAY